MNTTLLSIILIIINYLAGSISSAVIVSNFKKVDIRNTGYRTAGGSNVMQNIGIKWGIVVAIFDVFKGVPILLFAKYLEIDEIWLSFIALASLIGHCWPIWFKFAGGRGISTVVGSVLILTPKLLPIPLIILALTIMTSLLRRKKDIECIWISSATLTLVALFIYIFLTFKTEGVWDNYYSIIALITILVRRVSARMNEYKTSPNAFKLFLSRLIFDSSEKL